MKLITNSLSNNHKKHITSLVKNSDKIIICVAFVKNSGLENILKAINANCTFYVGTDFYITEPNALKKIVRSSNQLFLSKIKNSTYHPKIYYFRKGTNVTVIIGSANLTNGGFETNFETSILIEENENSKSIKEIESIIDNIKMYSTLLSTEIEINQYEREYNSFHKKIKKAKDEFDKELKKSHKIDFTKIKKYLLEYKEDNGPEKLKHRISNYKIVKNKLNDLCDSNISSPNMFLNHYNEIAILFHSSGLLRGKSTLAKSYKRIINCIDYIRNNSKSNPIDVFEKSIPLVKKSPRFGINALTEIMNTFNPNNFSVANGRTMSSLTKLGFKEYPDANNFTTEIYEDYNNLIKDIAKVCGFKDLGEVDYFLSWYYEKYIKKRK